MGTDANLPVDLTAFNFDEVVVFLQHAGQSSIILQVCVIVRGGSMRGVQARVGVGLGVFLGVCSELVVEMVPET